MTSASTLIMLFVIATAVAIAARRLHVPYTVALVLAGVAIGTLGIIQPPHLTKELLFPFILPGLLFDAAYNIDFGELRKSWRTVTALAAPGVVVAIGLTGAITTLALRVIGLRTDFSITLGLVFGGLVAATDPIAVVALFRSMRAPSRLTAVLEGESLLNDGTSIVFLTLILAYIAGTTTTTGAIAGRLVAMVGGGLLTGIALGVSISRIIARIDDAMIEITLTVIAAYGSFALAEQLHFSGVLGTVACGMACGSYGRQAGMSPATQVAVHAFWEYTSFALNSIVFLLVGFTVPIQSLLAEWPEIVIAYTATIIGRAGVVAIVTLLFRRSAERLPTWWPTVLTWGGLRGALSVVLALGLAPELPQRALLQTMTLGVVFLSLVVQGLTMAGLLRKTGLAVSR